MKRVILATAFLAGLTVPAGAQQTLRIGIGSDPDALDPTLSRTVAGRQVFAAMCDKLIDIDEKSNLVPQLATSWSWSTDGRTLSLKLRPGVSFHDGEKMDAAAVKASLDRHLTMQGSTRRSEMGPIKQIAAVGADTVDIELNQPFAPLISALADRAGMIMSPKAIAALGDRFANAPVCAGPFKFVRRVALDRIELERFADYWDARNIHLDRIVYLPVPDGTVRLNNLRAGSLDLIEAVLPSDVADLKKDTRVRVAAGPGLSAVYISFNIANGPRAQAPINKVQKLREALDWAIDREALAQVLSDGVYMPGNQSVAPGTAFYARSVPVPKRDVAKARALIKEAGLERVKVHMSLPNTTEFRQAAEIIQGMVGEAGFDMELQVFETATLLRDWVAGNFESLLILWSGRVDIDGNIYSFKACDGALNGGKYCNAEVDRHLKDGRGRVYLPARLSAYEAAAKIYLAERPYIYLYHRTNIFAHGAKLEGLRLIPDGLMRVQGLRLR
ncbi:MAG: ABC transporter substrate-binding protein [Alphaproteobacteria bacterium]|nr:ABC transporter substrate-binding protein [Alphaproteobacteria bacterium]MCW5741489.1 ABC transporter substrate-binding protein [Alphaproteobacteria bacterium]